ncbi:glutathione peroxidase 7 [Pycnococcus provasolii]|uniref:Glutathione peroxidase n=1 Tax=Pycnococcus provasolii TaxID=41880 RepID=A0A830HPF9_9CHLO|nr:glutathione peroxidase 7 [Pycnococcus provasolii]
MSRWNPVRALFGAPSPASSSSSRLLQDFSVAMKGLTSQNYKELNELYDRFSTQGFEILAFPCNQFGGQEPGTSDEVREFAKAKGAKYPVFDKIDVNGPNADPLYVWLKENKGELLGSDIKWNFGKFLVDKSGKVNERYAPTTSPNSIAKTIQQLL